MLSNILACKCLLPLSEQNAVIPLGLSDLDASQQLENHHCQSFLELACISDSMNQGQCFWLQANAAPKSEPLSSWFSFEDPGPLPPMPTPTVEEDTPIDPKGTSPQPPTASFAEPAVAKQPETQPSIDAWATPVEPSAETKATEKEVLASSLAGLDGDAWGGSSFGPDMGQPMGAAEPTGKAADTSAKGKSADISVKGTQGMVCIFVLVKVYVRVYDASDAC